MKYQHQQKRIHENGGFTIVEALIGVTILLLSITAVLSTASRDITNGAIAKDQITAFYLAQEAVEVVRNIRDNNSMSGAPWLSSLEPCLGSGTCNIDALNTGTPAVSCTPGSCAQLKLNSAKAYQYTTGNDTIFRREVQIRETTPGEEASVSVSIYWKHGLLERNFTIESVVFNWQL